MKKIVTKNYRNAAAKVTAELDIHLKDPVSTAELDIHLKDPVSTKILHELHKSNIQ